MTYALSAVVIVESITHVSPLAAPPLAMAASGLGLGVLVASGLIGRYGAASRPALRQ